MKIQTMSRKCQKRLKSVNFLTTLCVRPLNQIAIRQMAIHNNPAVICSPCVPTSVKKDERNALLCQLLPSSISLLNSVSSNTRKTNPSRNVTPNHDSTCLLLLFRTASIASPQVKLLVSSISVSARANGRSKSSRPPGPPNVFPWSTA